MRPFSPLVVAASLALPAAVIAACGGDGGAPDDAAASMDAASEGALTDRGHLDEAFHPDAACNVTVETPPLLAGAHVAVGTAIQWSSNPPSSGPHFPIWAAFQTFSTPVDRGYYVHDLEHGAVALLYKCDAADGCPGIVQGLERIVSTLADDPLCTRIADQNGGIRVRAIITPDPLLDVPVAAAAWGWTYKADCFDEASLLAFAQTHYGQGTERNCTNGQTQF